MPHGSKTRQGLSHVIKVTGPTVGQSLAVHCVDCRIDEAKLSRSQL